MALNARQRHFVSEYFLSGHATEAAKKAGYSEKTAYSQGHDLLKKPEILQALAEKREARDKRAMMDADRVVAEITKIALDEHTGIRDRLKALELLGKTHAVFTDKQEHVGTVPIRINWSRRG